jgi:hypothetical protein
MRLDGTTLVAGAAIAALGGLLVLDRAGAIRLDFGWLGAAVAAVVGVILLVSGLDR